MTGVLKDTTMNARPFSCTSLLLLALAVGLTGCQSKEQFGQLAGAVAGGLAGSQIGKGDGKLVAVGVGTLIGALVGSEIGASLDKADQLYAAQATQSALENTPSGTSVAWSNPDSGNSGTVVPKQAVFVGDTYCREFVQEIMVGGEMHTGVGRACRNPDGTWQVQPM